MKQLPLHTDASQNDRFPAQDPIAGASKIPTVVYYDSRGTARAFGAEATTDEMFASAQEGDWYKAEWCVAYLLKGKPITDRHEQGSNFTSGRELARGKDYLHIFLRFHRTKR